MERAFAFAVNFFSASTLSKKAYLNSLAASLDYCARFVVAFLVTPVLVAGLGDALYGVWVVILRMTDYLAAGGRSSQALKWFIVNRQGSPDVAEKRQGVGGAIAAWIVFLPLQLTVGGVVAWYLPVWLGVESTLFPIVRGAAYLVVASLILRGCVDVPLSVLIGENLGYKRMWISAPLVAVGGGLTILALRLETGIVGVACAMVGTVLLTGLTYVVVIKRSVPWFGISLPDATTLRRFIGWSCWFTLWELVSRVMMVSDVLLLGIVASPEAITVYALVRYLPEGVLRFLTVLVFETIPGIGKIYASGDLKRAASMRGEVMLLAWLATTSVGASVLLWNLSFMRLWVGPQYAVDALPMLLIVSMIYQFAWIRADADFINLSLDLKHKVSLGFVSAAVSLVLAVFFVRWTGDGIVGLCLGFIIGRSILSIGYPLIIAHVFQVPLRSQLAGFIRPGVVTVGLFLITAKLSVDVDVDSWLSFVPLVAASSGLIMMITYLLGLSGAQRRTIRNRLRLIAGKIGV